MKKSDATRARRVIQGLIAAVKQDIDLSKLATKELLEKIEGVGTIEEYDRDAKS